MCIACIEVLFPSCAANPLFDKTHISYLPCTSHTEGQKYSQSFSVPKRFGMKVYLGEINYILINRQSTNETWAVFEIMCLRFILAGLQHFPWSHHNPQIPGCNPYQPTRVLNTATGENIRDPRPRVARASCVTDDAKERPTMTCATMTRDAPFLQALTQKKRMALVTYSNDIKMVVQAKFDILVIPLYPHEIPCLFPTFLLVKTHRQISHDWHLLIGPTCQGPFPMSSLNSTSVSKAFRQL